MPIPGYPRYLVSTLGRVMTPGFVGYGGRISKAKILKSPCNGSGRPVVSLSRENEAPTLFSVHQLVALVFLGPPPLGMQVAHNNGIKDDNRICNLRYDTPKGNGADKKKHGTSPVGEKNPNSKLSDSQVLEILSDPESGRLVAMKHGIHMRTVYKIRHREIWKHVKYMEASNGN